MDDLAINHVSHIGQADTGMRPHVEAMAGREYPGTQMIQEDEGAYHGL